MGCGASSSEGGKEKLRTRYASPSTSSASTDDTNSGERDGDAPKPSHNSWVSDGGDTKNTDSPTTLKRRQQSIDNSNKGKSVEEREETIESTTPESKNLALSGSFSSTGGVAGSAAFVSRKTSLIMQNSSSSSGGSPRARAGTGKPPLGNSFGSPTYRRDENSPSNSTSLDVSQTEEIQLHENDPNAVPEPEEEGPSPKRSQSKLANLLRTPTNA